MSFNVKARRIDAMAARARLSETIAAIKHKTNPKVIAQEAVDSARERASEAYDSARDGGVRLIGSARAEVRDHPEASAAVAAAAAAIVFRKPLGRLFSKIFTRRAKPEPRKTIPLAVVGQSQEDIAS